MTDLLTPQRCDSDNPHLVGSVTVTHQRKRYSPGRIGLLGYTRILSMVRDHGPMTAREAGATFSRSAPSMREILWAMVRADLLHVHEWRKVSDAAPVMSPVFAFGQGPGANYPHHDHKRQPGQSLGSSKDTRRIVIETIGTAVRLMRDGATRADIMDATTLAPGNLAPLLRLMVGLRLIRVAKLLPRDGARGGRMVQVFQVGEGPAAQRPPRMSAAQRSAQSRRAATQRQRAQRVCFALAGVPMLRARQSQEAGA